jgi:hypothetical protein
MSLERYMTLKEAAEQIGLPKSALETEVRAGRLMVHRIAGKRFVTGTILLDFQRRCQNEAMASTTVQPRPALRGPMSVRPTLSSAAAKREASAGLMAARATLADLKSQIRTAARSQHDHVARTAHRP